MEHLTFDCGCQFPKVGDSIKLDITKVNFKCQRTWDLLSKGLTKGVFQLESQLGQTWTKRLKPENMENLIALGSILRPGCISGDTRISRKFRTCNNRRSGLIATKGNTIQELYYGKYDDKIISLDENTYSLYVNKIDNIIYTGCKEVYRPNFTFNIRNEINHSRHNLECTIDHMLFTYDNKWVELGNLNIGDRVAVIRHLGKESHNMKGCIGEFNFSNICFQNYKYCCIFCNWQDGSLDVNHLDDNRKYNNDLNNLCFMCPNHHRMYTEGKISKEQAVSIREQYIIKNYPYIIWAMYQGKELIGTKDTYDIKVNGPNHNFIAGNVIVHNCLNSRDANNISTTEHYCRRKNHEEPVEYFHPALEPILNKTYGQMIFQEQAMSIARAIAGFNLQEADELRKSMGKKLAAEMSAVEIKFLEGTKRLNIVTETEAKQIFAWIKESQRYLFNRSHAACYAINGYYCAYCKAHFPVQMYNSWLDHTKDKQEVRDLINEAKLLDIQVLPPNIINLKPRFHNDGNIITFGLTNIQKVGDSIIKKLDKLVREQESIAHKKFKDWTWLELLARIGPIKQEVGRIGQSALASMISVGALRHFHPNRTLLLAELDKWAELSSGEAHFIANNLNKFTSLIEAMRAAAKLKKEGGGCHSIERQKTVNSLISLLENPPTKLEDSVNWIAGTEEILLGIAVTCSRVDGCDLSAVNTTCKDFHDGNIKVGSIIMGVELEDIQELKTKTGKTPGAKMARLTISDGTCSINAICWPESYKNLSNLLVKGNTLIVQGYKDRKQGGFIISQAYQADLLDSGEN